MSGLIFISHASQDQADVNSLMVALRHALKGRLRFFNTSSGDALSPGEDWRGELLGALDDADAVILWGTISALESKEVAFEIGAAAATHRYVIPCCVHISPDTLPWGLDDRQALKLDTEDGWIHLAERIAEVTRYPGKLELDSLRELARRFEAPDDALVIEALGYTVELKNRSQSRIDDIRVERADRHPLPTWAREFDVPTLAPEESVVMFRGHDEGERALCLSWSDVTGATRKRTVTVRATAGGDDR
ncbi:MAG TPA: TIR domain-containing protein [Solirubrobacterales bacterium]|nr:TIR domain-containing protein [Solirubrobacterales bacterium]